MYSSLPFHNPGVQISHCNMLSGTLAGAHMPTDHQAILVEQQTQFALASVCIPKPLVASLLAGMTTEGKPAVDISDQDL